MRISLLLAALVIATPVSAAPHHHAKKAPKHHAKKGGKDKKEMTPEQKEADRHFKAGVGLFGEQKFAEALAEFERAYEISPAPIVLYNIAGCHRELSQYGDAVKFYNRFLAEGEGKVPKDRLAAATTELAGILARIARVTVTVTPDGAAVSLDGDALGTMPGLEMPLIVAPGEHKLVAHLDGKLDGEKTIRVASGDTLDVALALADEPAPREHVETPVSSSGAATRTAPKHLSLAAGFGTNLQQVSTTGVPSIGLGVAIGSRLELAVDATFVAYAVIPSVRVRLAGDRVALHLIAAVPVAFTDGAMSQTFVAGAGGLGIRIRATPTLALYVNSFAAYAGKDHGTTFPAFVGGSIWF